jgi:hypothetical protein
MRVIVLLLSLTCLSLASTCAETPPSEPEFDRKLASMLHSLAVVGDSDTPEHITAEIIAFCGPEPVLSLLNHLKYVHNRGVIFDVRQVLKAVKSSAVDTIVERLRVENDPGQKGKLILCLMDYDGPKVMRILKAQLDDARMSDESQGFEWGPAVGVVRNEAYKVILDKLEKGMTHEERLKKNSERPICRVKSGSNASKF